MYVNKISDGADLPENGCVGRNMLQIQSVQLSQILCPLLVKSVIRLLLMGMTFKPVSKGRH